MHSYLLKGLGSLFCSVLGTWLIQGVVIIYIGEGEPRKGNLVSEGDVCSGSSSVAQSYVGGEVF